MEPQDSRLTPGRIALAVLGALLLLPGLCGAVFMGGLLFEHLDRKSLEMGEFDLLVWLIAQPSYHFGCLVLYFIARQRGPGPWQSAARIAALAGLLATILVIVLMVIALEKMPSAGILKGYAMFLAAFLGSFLVGGLPALLVGRREKRENAA